MQHKSLDQQLIEYRQQRALAMPLSGMIVWSILFALSFILPASQMVMAIFIGTGSIVYLAMGVSKLTGEGFGFKKAANRNWFENVFLAAVGMCFLTFGISIPFFMENYLALPFVLAIQMGLMWLVHGVIAAQKVAIVHAIVRTIACVVAFQLWPELSFQIQPLIVVLCYGFSIPVMQFHWRQQQKLTVSV
ncbi:DUF7010 family protein [Shewanella litoralis]|uniref:DUF308 domain-containing protein n=1 Tax=Shewanella litoralis TaxID=2282700 RepID=A0ABQ2R965_9GAMM|nr:hypothetical protein [Shewanella litoralis]GGQ14756.1 hypothetical protein GCM10009411_14070 [Shewanella litoralis]